MHLVWLLWEETPASFAPGFLRARPQTLFPFIDFSFFFFFVSLCYNKSWLHTGFVSPPSEYPDLGGLGNPDTAGLCLPIRGEPRLLQPLREGVWGCGCCFWDELPYQECVGGLPLLVLV